MSLETDGTPFLNGITRDKSSRSLPFSGYLPDYKAPRLTKVQAGLANQALGRGKSKIRAKTKNDFRQGNYLYFPILARVLLKPEYAEI
jgi:hypothetical protein